MKNLPAVQETWVRSLGREDPLEEEMATHSSILAWKIPWTEEPRGLQSRGSQTVGTTEQLTLTEFVGSRPDRSLLQTVTPALSSSRVNIREDSCYLLS